MFRALVLTAFYLCAVLCSRQTSFDIDDYGADPTGKNDSTTAIQTAINSAIAVGGGVVIIPPGNYRITSPLAVTSSPIRISGSSPQSSWIVADFKTAAWALNVETARGVVFENFGINCASSATGTSGLILENSFIVTLQNLEIQSCAVSIWVDNTGNLDMMSLNLW